MGTRGQTQHIEEVGRENDVPAKVILELGVFSQFRSREKESRLESCGSDILFQPPQDTQPKVPVPFLDDIYINIFFFPGQLLPSLLHRDISRHGWLWGI